MLMLDSTLRLFPVDIRMYDDATEGKSHRNDAGNDVFEQYAQIHRELEPGLYGFLSPLRYVY